MTTDSSVSGPLVCDPPEGAPRLEGTVLAVCMSPTHSMAKTPTNGALSPQLVT